MNTAETQTMTTENTATTEAAAPKAPSKMELSRPLFNEIHAEGYVLREGSKSARSEFVTRAQDELGLTKAGAATYYQNLTNEKAGKPLYGTKKKADVKDEPKAEDADAPQAPEAPVEDAEVPVEATDEAKAE